MSKQPPYEPAHIRRGDKAANGPTPPPRPTSPQNAEHLAHEQTVADAEQTLADTDQTLSDTDQTSADSDQDSADSDQVAAELDQAASDRDLYRGLAPGAHELSRDIRLRTALQRQQSAGARLETARRRDAIAGGRDLAARARDEAAHARDLAMAQRDAADDRHLGATPAIYGDLLQRVVEQRRSAAQRRTQAAEYRALAAQDREAAASDREQAHRERVQAAQDRDELIRQLANAETDSLTGARMRAAGLTELDHELDRCVRTGGLLVVVYVDVIGLKAVNDSLGHAAGDELLKRVVTLIREHLRSYDLIIRLGGDEFLCAMSNITLHEARQRFRAITTAPEADAIRTGFAQLTPDETAAELIQRADRELVDNRPSTAR